MSAFTEGERVTITEVLPLLAGQMGTITNPDYMGYVMVYMDNPDLRQPGFGCFLPEELEKHSQAQEGAN